MPGWTEKRRRVWERATLGVQPGRRLCAWAHLSTIGHLPGIARWSGRYQSWSYLSSSGTRSFRNLCLGEVMKDEDSDFWWEHEIATWRYLGEEVWVDTTVLSWGSCCHRLTGCLKTGTPAMYSKHSQTGRGTFCPVKTLKLNWINHWLDSVWGIDKWKKRQESQLSGSEDVIDDTFSVTLSPECTGADQVALPALTAEEAEVLFRHHWTRQPLLPAEERRFTFRCSSPVTLLESCSVLPSLPEFHASGSLPSFKQILSEDLIFEVVVFALEKRSCLICNFSNQ